MICGIVSNTIYAEWATAFGTILLALITFMLHILGDSYTKFLKEQGSYAFKIKAFKFLEETLCSWSKHAKAPNQHNITVEENIEIFNNALLENQIYLSNSDRKKLKKYISIARKYCAEWEAWRDTGGNNPKVESMQKEIILEMVSLSKRIGKESAIQNLKSYYPYLFKN